MTLSSNIFQYFSHLLTKLSDFCVIVGYKCFLSVKGKEVVQKTQDKEEDE
jgi:hypothetical protein